MAEKNDQKLPSLMELLPEERISVNYTADDWKMEVKEAGRLLFETGAVKAEYTDAMIQTAEELGP
jgi:mannitol operon transcriptional antiterminator